RSPASGSRAGTTGGATMPAAPGAPPRPRPQRPRRAPRTSRRRASPQSLDHVRNERVEGRQVARVLVHVVAPPGLLLLRELGGHTGGRTRTTRLAHVRRRSDR